MKRDLKINFHILEEILEEVRKYKTALEEMEQASAKMVYWLEESEAAAVEKLEKIYRGFSREIKNCYTELEDLEMILANYTYEMQAIIKPIDKYSLVRVDRNDIWFNMKDIISACQEIGDYSLNLNYLGSYAPGFAQSEEEKYREERNYRKLEEIRDELISRYKRKLAVQIDALNEVYNRKIVPFENKDDEYGKKASWLCEKYSSFWERIRANFRFTIKTALDLVRGAGTAIIDLVGGLAGLAKGIIVYTSSAGVLAVTAPFNARPEWAEKNVTETNAAIAAILKEPMLIVEGICQQVSDVIEEEGVAYGIGYVTADILGGKGLGKLAETSKTKLLKNNKIVEDIGDVPKVTDDIADDITEITKVVDDAAAKTAAEVVSRAVCGADKYTSAIKTGTMYGDDVTSTVATVALDVTDTKIISKAMTGTWEKNPSIVRTTLTNSEQIIAGGTDAASIITKMMAKREPAIIKQWDNVIDDGSKAADNVVERTGKLDDFVDDVVEGGANTVSYKRPSKFRKGVKKQTWQQAVDASEDGIVKSPGGKVINETDDWQMGHKPGYEFRKHRSSAERRGISRKDFLDEHNNPNHYRPELPEDNLGHKFEGPDDLDFWDD